MELDQSNKESPRVFNSESLPPVQADTDTEPLSNSTSSSEISPTSSPERNPPPSPVIQPKKPISFNSTMFKPKSGKPKYGTVPRAKHLDPEEQKKAAQNPNPNLSGPASTYTQSDRAPNYIPPERLAQMMGALANLKPVSQEDLIEMQREEHLARVKEFKRLQMQRDSNVLKVGLMAGLGCALILGGLFWYKGWLGNAPSALKAIDNTFTKAVESLPLADKEEAEQD